jgi:tyrosyl-tRNA synthetase
MDAAAQARFDLISDNLAEFLNPEIIENILIRGDNPKIYWGTGESRTFFFLCSLPSPLYFNISRQHLK